MAVNRDALFLGVQACVVAFVESCARFAGGGAIVNNLSMASYMPNANNAGYHVSKAARMLTLCAAIEFGAKKVRVNSVHPGLTMTPLIREAFDDCVTAGLWRSAEAVERAIAGLGPLGISSQPRGHGARLCLSCLAGGALRDRRLALP